jgi:hypothetical protein
MTTRIINTHASKDAANFRPGSHLESVGVFFMNIYKPTPLPVTYCDEQIAELELRKDYENYRRENQLLTLLQCEYLWMKIDLQIIYYNQCKKLTLKQNNHA